MRRTYRERFFWLVDTKTHGDRGVAYAKDFGGRGLSYWPTEWGGRPLPGLEMKAYSTPQSAVDAALNMTAAERHAAEKKNAKARIEWDRKRREDDARERV